VRLWLLWVTLGTPLLLHCNGSCTHEEYGTIEPPDHASGQAMTANHTVLVDGRPETNDITLNMTRLYFYENLNTTTMNQPERYRKLIISLEPCEGVVYLFVRKTRRCFPNPFSCCQPLLGSSGSPSPPPCNTTTHRVACAWTHFHSVIDGTRDGAPTFFEVPHTSTKYYFAVFAPREINLDSGVPKPRYRFTVLADVGAFPRPGLQGRLRTTLSEDAERTLEVSWDAATFIPMGISSLRNYYLYSSLLLASDRKQSDAVFMSPSKIMNSVCGLETNAVRYGMPISPSSCREGICRAKIAGIVPRRRYMLNIVAESYRGFNVTYSGIVVSTDWSESRHALGDWSEQTTNLIGAICGTVFGVLVIGYLWIVKLYK